MTDHFIERPPRILTPEARKAREEERRLKAEQAMRDHEVAQRQFHENFKRLKAERRAREASASR